LRIEDAVYTSTQGEKAAISGGGINGKKADEQAVQPRLALYRDRNMKPKYLLGGSLMVAAAAVLIVTGMTANTQNGKT
jgi:hypothetical protein